MSISIPPLLYVPAAPSNTNSMKTFPILIIIVIKNLWKLCPSHTFQLPHPVQDYSCLAYWIKVAPIDRIIKNKLSGIVRNFPISIFRVIPLLNPHPSADYTLNCLAKAVSPFFLPFFPSSSVRPIEPEWISDLLSISQSKSKPSGKLH